jgi:nuclear transport factor 2 (NTF2) superfamily protein
MSADTPTDHELIGRLYDAYNDRDLDALTALVGEDLDWPDGDERLHGQATVRNYWSRQWARIHTQDTVAGVADLAPDRAIVRINQVIRDLDGAIVSAGAFEHAYAFKDGLVERMDLRKL